MLLLYAIAAGLIVGRLRGGRVSALADLRIRWVWLAVGGLAFQALLFSPPVAERIGSAGALLYVLSSLVVLAVLLRNLGLPGLPLVAVGAFLNLAAIVANGGYMPSDPAAWLTLTGEAALPTDIYSNSMLIGPGTALAHLGDLFVLPRPIPLANVFSIGDALIAVGIAWCVGRSMRAPDASSWHRSAAAPAVAR